MSDFETFAEANSDENARPELKEMKTPVASLKLDLSPAPALGTPTGEPKKAARKSPRRTPRSRMRRANSALALSSPINRKEEGNRWDDFVLSRTKEGITSPLRIHVNALRLFEPERVTKVTGVVPKFDVWLPDPFMATPDRRHHRRQLDRSTKQLSFRHDEPSSSSSSSSGGMVTPRAVRVEELTALLSPVSPGSPVRKLRRKRASRRLASKTLPALGARSELEWGPSTLGAAIPRGGSIGGLVSWTLREGSAENVTALLMARGGDPELLSALRQAFVADNSPERTTRQRGMAALDEWLRLLPWWAGGAHHVNVDLLQQLAEFVQHIATLHSQMCEQIHTQARFYAAAPALLAQLRNLQRQALDGHAQQQLADGAHYFEKRHGLPVLRADAETRALYPNLAEPLVWDQLASLVRELRHADARRLAQALTLIDIELLAPVSAAELLCGPRSGPTLTAAGSSGLGGTATRHALVCATRHWNLLSRWAPSVLLWAQPQPGKDARKLRAKLIRKFIDVAIELRAIGNWSALFALVVGLGSGAITTLTDSWALVPTRQRSAFHELEVLCQPIANFRLYRTALDESLANNTFCVPYLAIVLKDFEAISEGNPTTINSRGWLNFDKIQMLATALTTVKRLQNLPCHIKQADKRYMQLATHCFAKSEQEIWNRSTVVKTEEHELAAQPKKLFHLK